MAQENDLVTLEKFQNLTDAEIVKSMLESNGIPAMVTEQNNPFGATFTWPKVMVFSRDYEEAKRLFDEGQFTDVSE